MTSKFSPLKVILLIITMGFSTIFAQTGYYENFNSGGTVPSNYSGGIPYTLSLSNQTLSVKIAKADMFSGMFVSFPSPLNLSSTSRRRVSFKIRTDTTTRQLPFEIGIYMFSNPGQDGGRRANKVIYPTSKWQTITFDFNDPGFNTVNYSLVTGIQLVAQPLNNMASGTIYIDDVAVGDNGVAGQAAISSPYFLGFENQELYINSPTKTLRIKNAVDASNLNSNITFSASSSDQSILPNPTFSNSPFLSNSYVPFTSGNGSSNSLLSSRPVLMNMTPASNQFGMVTVTVTATVPTVTTALGTTTVLGTITLTGAPNFVNATTVTSNIANAFGNEEIDKLIDGNNNTKWLMNSASGFAIITLPTAQAINAYEMYTANDADDRDPKTWTLQGSNTNNGTDWVTLHTVLDGNLPLGRNVSVGGFSFSNTTAYRYFKWNVTAPKSSTSLMQVSELKLGIASSVGTTTGVITVSTVLSVVGNVSIPYSYIFTANVKRNVAPIIGTLPASLMIGSNKTTQVSLDNIFSGNGEVIQNMTIIGVSSDQSIISNAQIVVSFNGISTTAKAFITPVQFSTLPIKNCNITFTIQDNGGTALGGINQTQYVIPVSVYPVYFNQPTINVIPDQKDNLSNQGPRTLTLTGITDGNNASRISSVVAVSGNTSILANPTVSYLTGKNIALLTYNTGLVGSTEISVTATNFGAPGNSNGNSSFTRVFKVETLLPPLAGYIEPFTITTVVGPNDADGRSSSVAGTWFVENQGSVQNFTINSGTATLVQNKPGTVPQYFSGVWYKPNGGGGLFNFQTSPYLSVTLSTTNTAGKVAIDLWDVNDVRYGLSSELTISTTPTTYTFCYNGKPNAGFDFSKIKTVLFNFGVTPFNTGTGNWPTYAGTYTMSNLRLGSSAQGSGSCPPTISTVLIAQTPNPYHLATDIGTKTVTISGISAGSNPISGNNNNPVSLAVSGGLGATLLSFDPNVGIAVVGYTTTASLGSNVISITASAVGSTSTTRILNVNVVNLPTPTNLIVSNDLAANMADGQKGQTIDGSPFGVCEIFGSDEVVFADSYYEKLTEANIQSMRIGIYDFEPVNDNSDPNVLDKTKLDYNAMQVKFFKKASDAGVTRFLASFFSPPNFTKYNRASGVPAPPVGWNITNTIDSLYYDEYAEYAVAFVQGVKEKSGVDIYGLSIGNEIQFNQTYQSVVLNTGQYVEIIRKIGRRFALEGIKTFLWGAETLQAQDAANAYMKACQADPEVRNYFAGYAVHSYAANGVGAGGPNTGGWAQILADSRDVRSNGAMSQVRNSLVATVGPNGEVHNGNGGTGIPVHQTETSQGDLSPEVYGSWQNAMDVFGAVISSVNFGNVSGWYYIGLNENVDFYYTYKHINKYIFGGARRVPNVSPVGTSSSAFRNPDNSLTILIGNDNTSTRNISVGGTNMPSAFKAYMSVDNLFWKDMGTITGSIVMPPNSLVTLWGGGNALVAASGVTVTGAGNVANIDAAGGTLPLTATIAPLNLVDKSVSWTVINGTGAASINQNGLLTAESDGLVTVRATSVATPTVFGQLVVTITGNISVPLINLILTTNGSSMNTIAAPSGAIQFVPIFFPTTTTQQGLNWSISGDQTIATINTSGYLSARNYGNGIVTVTATSLSNASIKSSVIVSISGQNIAISGVTITGSSKTISVNEGTLQLDKVLTPINTLPGILWSTSNPLLATVGLLDGLVSAKDNGIVTITAYVVLPSTVSSNYIITISGQKVKSISLTPTNAAISTPNGTVQLTPSYFPINAEGKKVIYTTTPNNLVFVSKDGLVIGANNGNKESGVVVTATVEGTTITSTVNIPLTGQKLAGLYVITSTGATTVLDITPTLFIYKVKAGSNTLATVNNLGIVSSMDGGSGDAIIVTMLASDTTQKIERIVKISGSNTNMDLFVRSSIGGDVVSSNINVGDEVIIQPVLTPFPLNFVPSDYSWTFSSQGIVSVDNLGFIKGLANGVVTVTVTYLKNPTIVKTEVINVGTLGIANFENANKYFTISPNPTTGVVKVESNSINGLVVNVYNVSGVLVLNAKTKEKNLVIDLSNTPLGLYNVVVIGSNGVYSKKLVVE